MTVPGPGGAVDTAAIWSSLPVPGVVLTAQERIAALNPAAEMFLNASARALLQVPLWERVQLDTPLSPAMDRARAEGTTLFVNDVEVRFPGASRAPVQCNLQLAPLSEGEGRMILLISPRELAGRLGQSHSGAAAAQSAIGMAEMLAHEIKNPLAGITGAAQLLSMNLGPEDQELTDLIVAESRRIVKLLEQVEQFGNVSPPEARAVNLHDVLDRARRSAQLSFAAPMRIIEEYDPSLPPARGDADQLMQVVLNLLRNAAEAAARAGRPEGTVRLRTFYEHAFRLRRAGAPGQPLPLQIEVIDDGPGLPQDLKGDIFDPFVSGRENGTGLGLALVSKIISDHEGWISVSSAPGRTVFRISLPRAGRELEGAA